MLKMVKVVNLHFNFLHTSDSFIFLFSLLAQLEQNIFELETKQKKMSAATGRQNDELCAVKRERDQLKAKVCLVSLFSYISDILLLLL